MAAFCEMADVCGLADLGFQGSPWTFEKRVVGGSFCRSRLDRALASAEWMARYPLAELTHLTGVTSDHSPIFLCFQPLDDRARKNHAFWYEVMWESHENFDPFLKQQWQERGVGPTAVEVKSTLKHIVGYLKTWDRRTFGNVKRQISQLNGELARLCSLPARVGPSHEELKIVEKLTELYHCEEIMWKQRSRIQWLAAGDKNTKYFHQRASKRKKKKKIQSLSRVDGTTSTKRGEMGEMTREFYAHLYTTESAHNMDVVLDTVPRKVMDAMNEELSTSFTAAEVKEAMLQMFPTKALGPDGFLAHFFQLYWDLCGSEVTSDVLRILAGKDDPEVINETFIVLIPKVASPTELGQFRPISLCNVFYKIASKVLANRLKKILPEIISQEQSAFVLGRLITDNIITAYECLHFMKRNSAVKHRHCALKLDMRKAYDRVEWPYLRAIMIKLGFYERWTDLIMKMVSTVSFAVLFNGAPLPPFKSTRGIRQGDPISPYLFLLAAEGLSCLLKSRSFVDSSSLQGLMVANTAPAVNHLLFADDSLLFVKACAEGSAEVQWYLIPTIKLRDSV